MGINTVVPEVRACGNEGCGKLEDCIEMFGPKREFANMGCEQTRDVWFWSVGAVGRGGGIHGEAIVDEKRMWVGGRAVRNGR